MNITAARLLCVLFAIFTTANTLAKELEHISVLEARGIQERSVDAHTQSSTPGPRSSALGEQSQCTRTEAFRVLKEAIKTEREKTLKEGRAILSALGTVSKAMAKQGQAPTGPSASGKTKSGQSWDDYENTIYLEARHYSTRHDKSDDGQLRPLWPGPYINARRGIVWTDAWQPVFRATWFQFLPNTPGSPLHAIPMSKESR